ncbi:MAG: hypothetical protein E7557_06460 [Ruminococcaceae bacterium]|nr:hypothetical protein [Oscillospiraceae bacterium]
MKTKFILIFLLIFTFLLSSCDIQMNDGELYPDHQELLTDEFDFNNSDMRISFEEAGLKNLFIRDVSASVLVEEKLYGQVFLLGDDRFGSDRFVADHYLVLVTVDKVFVKDLGGPAYSGKIELCDFDGDGDSEILLHETTSITGGAGGYYSAVFDFNDGEFIKLFASPESKHFDTGFEIEILENNEFLIKNRFTQYSEAFVLNDRSEDYYKKWWYDENGVPINDRELWVDSFLKFKPVDIDNDGVYEIQTRQYTSLIGHSDFIGEAISILKYNNKVKAFEVIEAEFIPDNN